MPATAVGALAAQAVRGRRAPMTIATTEAAMLNLPAADFFEHTTDCVIVLDPDWRFILANENAVRELGLGGLVGH